MKTNMPVINQGFHGGWISKRLNSLKLSQKLAFMVLCPVVVMIGFAMVVAISALSLQGTTSQLQSMTSLGIHASNLVHELQKERGMTAGFIGSKGAKFGEQLKKQRLSTDEKAVALNSFLLEFDATSMSNHFKAGLKEALSRLQVIDEKRSSVDAQSIQLKDALGYYTGMNGAFLGLISEMSTVSSNGELAIMTAAYANFLQGKERAGIERAVLSNVFAKDSFGTLFNKFSSLVTTQENYTNVFLSLATEKDKQFYKETLKGEFVDEVEKMRRIARNRADIGGFGVDSGYWFKMQTGKINLLKKIENQLATGLAEKAAALKTGAIIKLIISTVIALIGLVVSAGLGLIVGRGIRAQMGGEPAHIEQIAGSIANGSLDMELGSEDGTPTGVYAAMIRMQEQLSDVIEKDIQSIVDAAKEGDLSQRIKLQGKAGFYEKLSSGINDLVEVSDAIVGDTVRVFGALAEGDLSESIDREYQGSFNQLKQDANTTIERIREVIEGDIQAIVDTARAGDLDSRIGLEGKEGFFRDLSTGINDLLETLGSVFNDISSVMGTLAKGDLTQTMTGDYQGEFARINEALNTTINQLRGTVGSIRESGQQVNHGSSEISQGNTILSERTEEQAASLEETAASMEQMTSSVKQNADNAQHANQLAAGARDQAQQGGKVASAATEAMSTINQSSKKIAEIIGIIDDIAFQTNLLALNAAVEAARAGEQGRGFAVVAAEVRSLALRSASAAKDIKSLIQDSVQKVEEGSRLVDESSKSLDEIALSIKTVSDIVAEITVASHEQATGIAEVNKAISQMDEVTQHNAALVEETAAASDHVNQQIEQMMELMKFFSIDEGSTQQRSDASNVHEAYKYASA